MTKLVVYLANGKEVAFVLQGPVTVGRLPSHPIVIPDDGVSKNHCEFVPQGSDWLIKDLGTTNGTIVNAVPVPPEGTILKDRDELSIGGVRAIFHQEQAAAVPPKSSATRLRKSLTMTPLPEEARHVKVTSDFLATRIQGTLKIETSEFLSETMISDVTVLRRDYEKLRITYELMRVVGQEIDLDRILGRILEYSFAMLAADRGAILIYDQNGILLPRAYRFRNQEGEKEVMISSSMVKMIESDKVGILSFDASKDPRFNLAQSIISQGIRSSMGVPLLHQGEVLGILFLDSLVSSNAFSEKDLHVLSNMANHAAVFVANATLARKQEEEAVARARLQRMFSPGVADMIATGKSEVCPGGEPRRTTILFSDIRGFTSLSETMDAEEIVSMVNEYFELMVDVIFKYDGTLDKFVGDEIMAVFGAPISRPDDAFRAVQAALEMQTVLQKLNEKRTPLGKSLLEMGIGINTGDVVAGYIGSSKALQYTVIGSPVNLANRLCSRARDGITIVISPTTWADVKDQVETLELAAVPLKGITNPIKTYQVLGLRPQAKDSEALQIAK